MYVCTTAAQHLYLFFLNCGLVSIAKIPSHHNRQSSHRRVDLRVGTCNAVARTIAMYPLACLDGSLSTHPLVLRSEQLNFPLNVYCSCCVCPARGPFERVKKLPNIRTWLQVLESRCHEIAASQSCREISSPLEGTRATSPICAGRRTRSSLRSTCAVVLRFTAAPVFALPDSQLVS